MPDFLNTLRRHVRDRDGGGTVFGLYIFCVMLMIFGLAIDLTNTWRNRTALTATVDIAAHAGAVAYANGGNQDAIKTAVSNALYANLPASNWGNMIDVDADVHFGAYDPVQYGWTGMETGNDNGVVVQIHKSRAYGNPVATFVMGLMGVTDIDLDAISAAVYAINGECNLNDGIYAEGIVTITTQAYVGSDYCIHSNEYVWLPQQNTFHENSMVTMSLFSKCENKCDDDANPGINARPAHMIFPDIGEHILATYAAFDVDGIPASGVKYEWFYKQTDTDAADYDASDPEITLGLTNPFELYMGLPLDSLKLGDVVDMTYDEFMGLTMPLPSGLVYNVACTKGGKFGEIVFDAVVGQMDGGVLLTSCRIQFDTGASVKKSIVITTATSANGAIDASEGTTMGDPTNSCGDTDRSIIMSMADVNAPADFTMSNLTLIVDGNVNIAAISNGATVVNVVSYGFAVYASGNVNYASKHTFESCGNTSKFLTPEGKILRLVVPPMVDADGNWDVSQFVGPSDLNLGAIHLDPYVAPSSGSGETGTDTGTDTGGDTDPPGGVY